MSFIDDDQITIEQLEEGLARMDAKIYELGLEIRGTMSNNATPFLGMAYEPTEEEALEIKAAMGEAIELFEHLWYQKHQNTILERRIRAKYGTEYTIRDLEELCRQRIMRMMEIQGLMMLCPGWTWFCMSKKEHTNMGLVEAMRHRLTEMKAECEEIEEENERMRARLNE